MMNLRLVLLLFFLGMVSSATIVSKRASAEEIETNLRKVNDVRATFAMEQHIGNMYELTWDSELEKQAHAMGGDCNFKAGPYVFIAVHDIGKMVKELYHPLQTKVACVELVAPCTNRGIGTDGFCVMGPHNSPASDKDIKKGPPGSHCDGKLADNGLCRSGSGSSGGFDAKSQDTPNAKAARNQNKEPPEIANGPGEKKEDSASKVNSVALALVSVFVLVL